MRVIMMDDGLFENSAHVTGVDVVAYCMSSVVVC